jgi:hypothetical protein
MRHALLILVLVMMAEGMVARAPSLSAQMSVPVQIGKLSLSTVAEWKKNPCEGQATWISDTCAGLIVSNNADGELRLAEGSKQAVFTTALTTTSLLYNAVGAVWRADMPAGTSLTLEIRGGTSTNEADLTPWHTLASGDARSQSDDGALALESVQPFPGGMAVLQFRATFNSTVANASPVLSEITLSFISSTAGPARLSQEQFVPAPYGPATLTPPPLIVQRESWGASAAAAPIVRQAPRGIILHQIGSDDLVSTPPFLRALLAYDTQVLGWDDLPFHFIIDRAGAIYAGRSGGPTSLVSRFAAGDAAIHVALIGGTAPPSQQQSALVGLLAWLGQAYNIPPIGEHAVTSPDGKLSNRPNIVTHADISADAADPAPELRAQADALRQNADRTTVRARWYFAEGNTFNFVERLAILNSSAGPSNVRFTLLRQPGPPVVRDATVPAGGRADLVVNSIFSDTTDVPAIVEANTPVIAERFMNFGNDITSGTGVSRISRVWYFAEGATQGDNKTYLLLFNPQSQKVKAAITYMQSDGTTAQQSVEVAALQRTVVTVGDALPGSTFGTRVIATQPIVAERTMIFGAGSTPNSGGVHTAPGVSTLSRRWYFAEGTTQAPFKMSILVLNPNAQAANVAVTFLTDSGTSLTRKYAVPPTTQLAIPVNEVVPELGIATTIAADRPIAAERALYWNNNGAGTASAGAPSPAYTWRFADGRTSENYQEYLLLSNPTDNQARVTVDFVLADGKTAAQSLVMAKGSRYTMPVHQLYPGQVAIAATVRATQPIVAERSLFPGAPGTEANRGGATALGVAEDLP